MFFSELCWGKAMATYTKPQQRKKEESERGERDQIKFIDLRFEKIMLVVRIAEWLIACPLIIPSVVRIHFPLHFPR